MSNLVTCLFFDRWFPDYATAEPYQPTSADCFAGMTVSKWGIVDGEWRVVGPREVQVPRIRWPNERHRAEAWVGLVSADWWLANELVEAWHGMRPWDAYYKPDYLDQFLMPGWSRPGADED